MTIQINYEAERKLDIDYEKLASEVAEHILETENCPYDVCVNLVITDNEEIKRVNTEFRSIGAPTDVLSFPMIPFKTPADYSVIEGDDSYFFFIDVLLSDGDHHLVIPRSSSAFACLASINAASSGSI